MVIGELEPGVVVSLDSSENGLIQDIMWLIPTSINSATGNGKGGVNKEQTERR